MSTKILLFDVENNCPCISIGGEQPRNGQRERSLAKLDGRAWVSGKETHVASYWAVIFGSEKRD